MSLEERISNDLRIALKKKRELEVRVLRMIVAALQNKAIEKRGRGEGRLSEEEVAAVLRRELKKRQEAAALYCQGGRKELAEAEEKEADVIQCYLPQQMKRREVEEKIKEILSRLGEDKDFGKAMKAAMAELKNRADGKIVAEIIKEELGK